MLSLNVVAGQMALSSPYHAKYTLEVDGKELFIDTHSSPGNKPFQTTPFKKHCLFIRLSKIFDFF